jgi:hypothetical protein
MKTILAILILNLFLISEVSADPGASHILKARIKLDDKEYVGYFNVWGYLYLEKDSLTSWTKDISKFTYQVKKWIYGDSLKFYSEIIKLKDYDLVLYPTDKLTILNKNSIKEIYPLDLINCPVGMGSYSRITSSDNKWLLNTVIAEESFYIENGAACDYTVLYFNKPDSLTTKLVKAFESELQEEANLGTNRYKSWIIILDRLRDLKVIIFSNCAT